MDRRQFIKSSAVLAAATASPSVILEAAEKRAPREGRLIISAPMLQNYASESMGVAFAVSDMANGFVRISEREDMSEARLVKCGGYRVTDMNDKVMLVRLTGLKPSTRYYYTIGADRISYEGGYAMKVLETETDPTVYSFTTAGKGSEAHFCVINDTHADWPVMEKLTQLVSKLEPSCTIWNGDASNTQETIDSQVKIFLNPPISIRDFASRTPYLFCPGNHDNRGFANRHLERVWMFRQPEERLSRDWDLGRNFAVRMGDIAMIGLDTAEDKVDENPIFAGLFNSEAYREAQVLWLEDALKRKEIASAPFLVAFCHIPLFDPDPSHNPGDIHPADSDPRYKTDYASWQRTCANLWTPLLEKSRCQLIITGHQHQYRFDAPDQDRKWAQIVGGGHKLGSSRSFPTVVEGYVKGNKLKVNVYNADTGKVVDSYTFKKR